MITEILQTISVFSACVAIIVGVDAWRREFIGKRRIELAEDVLTLFYEAQDAIRYIRNPFSNTAESEGRQKSEDEDPKDSLALDRAYVVFARYEKKMEVFNRLQAIRYRFIARFSPEATGAFDQLNLVTRKIFSAAGLLGRVYWRKQDQAFRTEKQFNNFQENAEKYEGIFWEGSSDPDPINPLVQKAITDIERICRPIIEEKGVGFILFAPFKRRN